MTISRRNVLIGLSASLPIAAFLVRGQVRAEEQSAIMKVSEVITARKDLDPKIGDRIVELLSKQVDGFEAGLQALAKKLEAPADRDSALMALNEGETKLALAIAQPWYQGIVGKPASFSDPNSTAQFVTFLQANAYDLVIDVVPRPGLSRGGLGWWAETPTGVNAPAMPEEIKGWSYQPDNIAPQIAEADPDFLALVRGEIKAIGENAQKDGSQNGGEAGGQNSNQSGSSQ